MEMLRTCNEREIPDRASYKPPSSTLGGNSPIGKGKSDPRCLHTCPISGRYCLIYHGPGTRPRKVYFPGETCIHPDLIYEGIITVACTERMCKDTTFAKSCARNTHDFHIFQINHRSH